MNPALLLTAYQALTKGLLPGSDPLSAVLGLLADALHVLSPKVDPRPIAPLPAAGVKQRIALCLGHARSGDEGAESAGGTSERAFNQTIILALASRLRTAGIEVIPVLRYQGSGYSSAMQWLAHSLLDSGATAAIEFHFNAADGHAAGHEFLYWANSKRGITLAKDLSLAFDAEFTEGTNRGLKPISSADRGAAFLCLTHCPACIVEPFFGDNSQEWNLFNSPAGMDRLVRAYASAITNWITSQVA